MPMHQARRPACTRVQESQAGAPPTRDGTDYTTMLRTHVAISMDFSLRGRRGGARALCLTCLTLAALSCGSPVGSDESPEQLWVSATRAILTVGDTTRVGFVVGTVSSPRFSHGIGPEPSSLDVAIGRWSSSDSAVAVISSTGVVTARAPGRAILRVQHGALHDTALVFVDESEEAAATRFVDVQVGLGHACGRTTDRNLYCWGSSWFGETGSGSVRKFTATLSPSRVNGITDVTALAVGDRHSCALISSGQAFCWGEEISAASGATGTERPTPLPIGGAIRFSAISVGGMLACGLTQANALLCWGFKLNGLESVSTPAPLTSITVGYNHACGLTVAGDAFCFGSNASGQLAMTAVATSLRFVSISAGLDYTCGVAIDRRAYCWGSASNGKLGTGDMESQLLPTPVASLSDVAMVDAGGSHTCATTVSGVAYCWGDDLRGEVGDGPLMQPNPTASDLIRLTPTRVELSSAAAVISAGWGESSCALDQTGRAYCWGLNSVGQLGIGRYDFAAGVRIRFRQSPVAVRMAP